MMKLRDGAPLPEVLRDLRLQLEVMAINQADDVKGPALQVIGLLLQAEGIARERRKTLAEVRAVVG